MKAKLKDIKFIRLRLSVWFLVLAIWTLFSIKTGRKVLIAYVEAEQTKDEPH